MQFRDAITAAIEHVLTWDLPDESLSVALSAEAGHLAGLDPEEIHKSD